MLSNLVKNLRKSKDNKSGLYYVYQSSMAMAFFDAYRKNKKKYKSQNDIIGISNQAAINFLDLLIKK